jgi:hypothetical protein
MKKIVSSVLGLAMIFVISSMVMAADMTGKKVLFIDSYHEGYGWCDGITAGVQEVITSSGAELKIHRMDTKRNTSDAFKKNAAP